MSVRSKVPPATLSCQRVYSGQVHAISGLFRSHYCLSPNKTARRVERVWKAYILNAWRAHVQRCERLRAIRTVGWLKHSIPSWPVPVITCKEPASKLAVGMPNSLDPLPKPLTTLPFSLQTGSRGTTPLIMSSKAGRPYCSGLKSSREGNTEQQPARREIQPVSNQLAGQKQSCQRNKRE